MNTVNHDCKTELRSAELKVTPARLGVLAVLESSQAPIDVSSITAYLTDHAIKADPATVFRIVNSFMKKGLARSVLLEGGKLHYEPTSKGEHHHLVCEVCGNIEDISDCHIGRLEKEITQKKSFMVKRHSLEFFGVCASCQP